MADERCEFPVTIEPRPVLCDNPAYRISQGRHYCFDHFDAVIASAKSAVVDEAIKLVDRGRRMLGRDAKLPPAVDKLLSLGWEWGD